MFDTAEHFFQRWLEQEMVHRASFVCEDPKPATWVPSCTSRRLSGRRRETGSGRRETGSDITFITFYRLLSVCRADNRDNIVLIFA
jgi:hypothetical protein